MGPQFVCAHNSLVLLCGLITNCRTPFCPPTPSALVSNGYCTASVCHRFMPTGNLWLSLCYTDAAQVHCAGSHQSPAPMQATKASNSCKHTASSNMCRLRPGPCTNTSHKGKRQLQPHSQQQLVQAHTRALHHCKPQRQATAASTPRAATCAG